MLCPQHSQVLILGLLQKLVIGEDGNGCLAGTLQQVGIERGVGNLQILSHAALLRAVYVARAAQLHIQLRESEAIRSLTHSLQTLTRLAR